MKGMFKRQTQALFGPGFEQQQAVLAELRQLAHSQGLSAGAAAVLNGLASFLNDMASSSEVADQYRLDEHLKLEVSQADLSQAHDQIRLDLESGLRAMASLRTSTNRLQRQLAPAVRPVIDQSLESLSSVLSGLVQLHELAQQQLQRALSKSDSLLQALDQHAIVSITDTRGVITYVNDNFCAISEFSRDDLLGSTHQIINSDVHSNDFVQEVRCLVASGQVWQGEVCSRSKSGRLYWVQSTLMPVLDTQGQVVKYIAIRTDITAAKLFDEKMAATEARIRRITNAVPAVVFQCEVGQGQLRFTYLSDRLREICGLGAADLFADAHLSFRQMIDEGRDARVQSLLQAAQRRLAWRSEYQIQLPCGALRWIASEMTPETALSPSGATVYTGIWRDITAAKVALLRLGDVTLDLPIAVYQAQKMPDGTHSFPFCNPAVEALCGVTAFEAMQDSSLVFAQVHPEDHAQVMRTIAQSQEMLEIWALDFRYIHKISGEIVWVHASSRPKRLADGSTLWSGSLSNITKARQISEDLRAAKELAESANRAKSDFLANMSHEIRTPMHGVLGMTELMLDTPLDAEQSEYMRIIKLSGNALLVVINDILDFSKIESGQLTLEKTAFDLDRLLTDLLKTLALSAHAKRLELVVDLHADVPLHLLGDAGRLRQILVNLLGNAIKFTAQGAVVLTVDLVRIDTWQHTVRFTVRDTGIGIAVEKRASIFEAFSQEDSSITRRFGGTGLGLPISAKLTQALGGCIEVSSEPGVGSEFSVAIPFELDEPSATAAPDLAPLRGLRVLVVDANHVSRTVLVALLKTAGMVVQALDSGEPALALLRTAPASGFDLLLLDDRAPGVNGFLLAQRSHPCPLLAGTHTVMMSASGANGEARKAYALGCAAYVDKPCTRHQWWALLLCVVQRQPSNFATIDTQQAALDAQRALAVQARSPNPAPD